MNSRSFREVLAENRFLIFLKRCISTSLVERLRMSTLASRNPLSVKTEQMLSTYMVVFCTFLLRLFPDNE